MKIKQIQDLLLILCMILAISSCDTTKSEPTPDPTPTPDTIPTPTPDPNPFESILDLNDEGELKSLPFPCIDWLGGEKAVQSFEQTKGATFVDETKQGTNRILRYKTNDPSGQQPIRLYIINADNILETSSIQIASKLIADGDNLNENMEILLYDGGYTKIAEAEGIVYSNGSLLLAFSEVNNSSWSITYKASGDPEQMQGILQIKDFPYLKKETKMSAYTFEEIEAYEKSLGLRKQTSKTSNTVTYVAIDPSKTNFNRVSYKIDPNDEGASGPVAYTGRFNKEMYKQPELRSYFELNGFSYESSFETYAEKFGNDELAVRIMLFSDGDSGSMLIFQDAPDLYDEAPEPEKPKFQPLYMPLLEAFGESVSADSPLIQKEKEAHPDCDIQYKASSDTYTHGAIVVYSPSTASLDPEDRSKPRATQYSYEPISGNQIERISYTFSVEWENANIQGDDPIIKGFMEQNGFTYNGMKSLSQEIEGMTMKVDLYQYYNVTYAVYFEYTRIVEPSFMTLPLGIYSKQPTVDM